MLKLNSGAKIMLTFNIDIEDRLNVGHIGNTKHIEFCQGSVSET